jgi:hypothetical protein
MPPQRLHFTRRWRRGRRRRFRKWALAGIAGRAACDEPNASGRTWSRTAGIATGESAGALLQRFAEFMQSDFCIRPAMYTSIFGRLGGLLFQ